MNDILFTPIRLNELELLIQNSVAKALSNNQNALTNYANNGDQLLTIKQAGDLLSLAVPTIYGLVSRQGIPCSKQGKRLYFSKEDLLKWIKSGRKLTISEIDSQAGNYLINKKGAKNA